MKTESAHKKAEPVQHKQILTPPPGLEGHGPEEFYGRQVFIDYLWRSIVANNILLLAPRRFGKTSVMRHILLHPHAGFLPLSFDLEDADCAEEFIWRITREVLARDQIRKNLKRVHLPKCIAAWMKGSFDKAKFDEAKGKFKKQISKNWQEAGKKIFAQLEKLDQKIIFLFDELPAMLDHIIEKKGNVPARKFLSWFRGVRLGPKDVLKRHRFVIAGSFGIDQVLHRIDASDKLVDFARLTVEPLNAASAQTLAEDQARSHSVAWSTELSLKLFTLIGAPVPYFIHLFFEQLGQLPPERRTGLTPANLEQVYGDTVLGPNCRADFTHYSIRLKRYGKAGEKAAVAVLQTVAKRSRVSRPAIYDIYHKARGKRASEQEFDELMADLEYDWYLRLNPGTNEYHFRLNVMRDWWRRWTPGKA